LGEGPLWVPEENAVYWVNILGLKLHRISADGSDHRSWDFPQQLTGIVQRANGGFVGTFNGGFALLDIEGGEHEYLGDVEPTLATNRFNDCKADAAGRLWAGTMDNDRIAEPTGSLYCLSTDLGWATMDSGYVVANGPTFSIDGRRMYHTDTVRREIYAFDLDENGAIGNKRLFVRFTDDEGMPDGMTTDSEDCIWVGHFGGWRLSRFSPSGKKLDEIQLPVANVTSCAFGGADYRTLFITTAAVGVVDHEMSEQPLAGSTFAVEPGCQGIPANKFFG